METHHASRSRLQSWGSIWVCLAVPALAVATAVAGFDGLTEDVEIFGRAIAISRAVGKTFGLWAFVLVTLQFLWTARLVPMESLLGYDRLVLYHRIAGVAALCLATFHPLLLFCHADFLPGPWQSGLWPETVGAAVVCLLYVVVLTALARRFLQLRYESWRWIHRLAFLAVPAVSVHVLALEPDWREGSTLHALLVVWVAWAACVIWAKWVRRPGVFAVTACSRPCPGVTEIRLRPEAGELFDYRPGQFAFFRPLCAGIPAEEHPFTLASTPVDREEIRVDVKASGDFSSALAALKPGDRVRVQGPFGRFSPECMPHCRRLLLVAGGIGITPMLSVVRTCAAGGGPDSVVLLWFNRTRADIFAEAELAGLMEALPDFSVHHVLTRELGWRGPSGHLDADLLHRLAGEIHGGTAAMVCGPPGMMRAAVRVLRQAGVPRRRILTEAFEL